MFGDRSRGQEPEMFGDDDSKSLGNGWKSQFPSTLNWLFGVWKTNRCCIGQSPHLGRCGILHLPTWSGTRLRCDRAAPRKLTWVFWKIGKNPGKEWMFHTLIFRFYVKVLGQFSPKPEPLRAKSTWLQVSHGQKKKPAFLTMKYIHCKDSRYDELIFGVDRPYLRFLKVPEISWFMKWYSHNWIVFQQPQLTPFCFSLLR